MNAEQQRLAESREKKAAWKKWGPYLSERQWGTVREDYSQNGNAWDYFTHDQARSRAYRWGEDGLAGISDDKQRLCFSLALWNGHDPILKERLFGLTNSEANHGEDVKEYYYYLDSTPTHSYMKYLYKYPQAAFPYSDLVLTNRKRTRLEFEYELIDTGVFNDNRYFDVFVEYAKKSPDDLLIRITAINRGAAAAELHLLPTLWFRNVWSWPGGNGRPSLSEMKGKFQHQVIAASDLKLGELFFYCDGSPTLLFTENETNSERIFGTPNRTPYVKDGFHNFVVQGAGAAVNPERVGTKAAAYYRVTLNPGETQIFNLRLSDVSPANLKKSYGKRATAFGSHFDEIFSNRRAEADEFYSGVIPPNVDPDAAAIVRQAMAGMLWGKQFYHYEVDKWLEERGSDPFKANRLASPRNDGWHHMYNAESSRCRISGNTPGMRHGISRFTSSPCLSSTKISESSSSI